MKRSVYLILFITVLGLLACSYPAVRQDPAAGIRVIEEREYLFLIPEGRTPATTGLLFYPGALVEPEAYIVPFAEFARRGYAVLIIKMPADLAILDSNRAVMFLKRLEEGEKDSGIALPSSWIGSGHSLGGTALALLANKRPELLAGMVFIASYPSESGSLAAWQKPVLSISASNDGLATASDIAATKNLLPPDTRYVVMEGGNHAQFGHYGAQKKDGQASIPKETQWKETADLLEAFFLELE